MTRIHVTRTERHFAEDHAAAQGHFPGNPIIPGAVLLSEALASIEAVMAVPLRVRQVISAKFLHPARPGDRVAIEFARFGEASIRLSCAARGRTLLKAEVAYEDRWASD